VELKKKALAPKTIRKKKEAVDLKQRRGRKEEDRHG